MDDQTAANDILTDINDIANIQIEKPNKVRADSSFKHRLVTNLSANSGQDPQRPKAQF